MDTLFEDENYIVLNKPAGIMVHGDGKTNERTLVNFVLEKCPEIQGVGDPARLGDTPIERSGVVHRLDQETSGAIIFAKNQDAFLFLKKQFQDRLVQKEYHAFVWGHFKELSGYVDEPIGRNKGDFRRWTAGRGIRGEVREAYTRWEVVQSFEDTAMQKFSFLKLYPKTGRTHQLRVHMKYLQRPIVSDHLYAPSFPDALGFTRVALHARKVTFMTISGESMTIEAPYPADFTYALAQNSVL
ncbi:MAG: RluA family pseudouridine synthase [bacterium]